MSFLLRLDSRDKSITSISNTDFELTFKTSLSIKKLKVKSVIIPNLFYNIKAGNNIFTYESNNVVLNLTVDVGLYSLTQLIAYLNQALSAINIVFSYNTITGKISVFNNSLVQFALVSDGNQLAPVLGIGNYHDVDFSEVYPLPYPPNLFNYSMIYVASQALASSVNMRTSDEKFSRIPVIAVIPVNAPVGSNIIYEPNDPFEISIKTANDISTIDLQIVNHENQVLYLPPNHHWQLIAEAS